MKRFLLFMLVAGFYALHQDFWNWQRTEPLLLGFLPVSLSYHAFYAVGAAGLMALLVKYAWPHHLDPAEGENSAPHPSPPRQRPP